MSGLFPGNIRVSGEILLTVRDQFHSFRIKDISVAMAVTERLVIIAGKGGNIEQIRKGSVTNLLLFGDNSKLFYAARANKWSRTG